MKRSKEGTPEAAAADMFAAAQVTVAGETVEVTLVNPEDPVERATFVQRKSKAAAWIVNDWSARIGAAAANIRPFEGK